MGVCATRPKKATNSSNKNALNFTLKTNGVQNLNISDNKFNGNDLQSPSPMKAQTVMTTAIASREIIHLEKGTSLKRATIGEINLKSSNENNNNNMNIQQNKPECSDTKSQQHKSVFLYTDDPISRIVKLEEACIRLKSRLEKEKQKQQERCKPKPSSLHSMRNNKQPQFNENDARCFATIIKLADFVQEKSQRLWEDPNDTEIIDALASLEYAAKMMQLECLLDFQKDVATAIPSTTPNKTLVRTQSFKQPQHNQETQQIKKAIKPVECEQSNQLLPSPLQQPCQPSVLQLPPPAQEFKHQSIRSRQSSQRCSSPSHPQQIYIQEEPENDIDIEKLAPETKHTPKDVPANSNISPNTNNLTNTVPQTNKQSYTIPDTLKLSNPAPTGPKPHMNSPFGSPVSPLALEPPSNCVQ